MSGRLSVIKQLLQRIIGVDDHSIVPAGPYVPAEYWENRADALIEGYDTPETWEQRGWLKDGVEEEAIPALLASANARSVLVVGAGSGRQYRFLRPLGLEIRGFDISPTLVATCKARYPDIETVVDTLVGAADRHPQMDAVLSTTVLQHVPPDEIQPAVAAVKLLAERLVVLRETTYLKEPSGYQWAHDYGALFEDWPIVHRSVTDENDSVRVELIAWIPPLERYRFRGDNHSKDES
jgi:SAM-dependent methyltransferase